MKKISLIVLITLSTYWLTFSVSYGNRVATSLPEVQSFIEHMVKQYHFDQLTLENLFTTVSLNDEVINHVNKPYEEKPWYMYRDLFITPQRINNGVAYWRAHEKILAQAEKQYGVPASVIIAIIGVETQYGDNRGIYPVFNTLTTLAFSNNCHRSGFFKSELAEYLLLTRENHLDPLQLKGSYAGAVGLPQFMPSSYRHYAVDFAHKGCADLFTCHADAICSVANYLHRHGWQSGTPIAISASVNGNDNWSLITKKYKPLWSEQQLIEHGVIPAVPLHDQKACYICLDDRNQKEHWIGLQNFYVISTYNNSALYVMAVDVLAQKIREARYH